MTKRDSLLAVCLLALACATPSTAVAQSRVSGRVTHEARVCEGGAPRDLGLPKASLLISRGAHRVRMSTGHDGRWTARVGGTGPITVRVILRNEFVKITRPATASQYSFSFNFPSAGANKLIHLSGNEAGGAANIFHILTNHGPGARKVLPGNVKLPRATVRFADPGGPTGSYHQDGVIYIASAPRRRQWEPATILHEYGHFFHHMVVPAGPSGEPDWSHQLDKSYPNHPRKVFKEGFAHGFRAVLVKSAQLEHGCRQQMDLSSRPATPVSKPDEEAQYNEVAIAAVFWHLANRLGSGDVRRGYRRVLAAMRSYKRDGRHPRIPRDLRDALIKGNLEGTQDEHRKLNDIFGGQRIGWDFSLNGENLAFESFPAAAHEEIAAYVEGDYVCPLPPGPYSGFILPFALGRGGLGYARDDDCWATEDGHPFDQSSSNDEPGIFLDFPYLANQRHRDGRWVVWVKYSCHDTSSSGACPAVIPWRAYLVRCGRCVTPIQFEIGALSLALNSPKPLIEFSQDGRCRLLVDGRDC